MPSPSRPPRRHARRGSSQRRVAPPPSDPQTPARRRNLYRPPASVVTRHAQVRHWHAELHDLTQNLADIQQRIQQLETVQYPRHPSQHVLEDSIPSASRSRTPSTPYRLPELGLGPATDSFCSHLDEWLHASPLAAPTSGTLPLPPTEDVEEQSSPLVRPVNEASAELADAHRMSHHRDASTTTVDSFDSYNTEAVNVCEASTTAIIRPRVKEIATTYATRSSTQEEAAPESLYARQSTDDEKENQPPMRLYPPPLFSKQKPDGRPRRTPSTPQPRSSLAFCHDLGQLRHSQPGSWLAQDPCLTESGKWRPSSGATIVRHDRQVSPSPTPSSAWVTESLLSDGTLCSKDSLPASARPSSSVACTQEQSSTPISLKPPQWLHSSPPPSEEPRLDSSCTSITDPPTPASSPPNTSARLNLFPKIQQSSQESLRQRYYSRYGEDPFYSVSQDQIDCSEWTTSPHPARGQTSETTDAPSVKSPSVEEPAVGAVDRPRRKNRPLREILSLGVRRQSRDMGSSPALSQRPRKKLRTFLRRFTPALGKARHSMPAGSMPSIHSAATLEQRCVTPPRLPTRRGSTLPFDEALLGELTKISDRRNPSASAAPSPTRRIRNSMHDAAGLTFSKTAATHAHWRAQRSRSSILSSAHPRSRALTGRTTNSSLSSGPSFYFLPKADQAPVTPVRRGPPMGRHRISRY
ncbi:hypothetical protein LTR09_006458 [Extremus antarcticus]|uniref:Uncharacterized protein n=1 Tax=Extremus antarcticus TaxID=702011 RepID=A0AAJ0G7X8_9PEZI|nr:hypothetical protein LTR09_006458 [Extremus antarcticus]